MGRHPGPQAPLDRQRYEHFVNAFITEGPHFTRVGGLMDCNYETARQIWLKGWPSIEWARPIKDVYAERVTAVKLAENPAPAERTQTADGTIPAGEAPIANNATMAPSARVEMVRVMSDSEVNRVVSHAVAQVKADVAKALLAERDMIGVARNNLTGVMVLSDQLLAGLQPLVRTVVERLHTMAADASVNPELILTLIDRVTKISKQAVEASKSLMEQQRLMVGMPQTISESRTVEKPAAPSATPDTAALDADRAELEERIARRLRKDMTQAEEEPTGELGLGEVSEGGQSE